jgi:hypothetical protein
MSPEKSQDHEVIFRRLKKNLGATLEFDISSAFEMFEIIHGGSVVYELDRRGFSPLDLQSFQRETGVRDKVYENVEEIMFELARPYNIHLEHDDFTNNPNAKLPIQMLFATLVNMDNPRSPLSQSSTKLIGSYLDYLATSHEQ